ncbi:MAG: hypothetical protein ABSB96_00635 [Gaiellaceae bacterium]
MRKLFKKPSPATVIACLALFVASTGTSIAASHYLITSTKQIKPSVLKQLKGAKGPKGSTGATGAAGAAGAAGATGATGPSDAWEAASTGEHVIGAGVGYTISVTVPAGSYDISGTADLVNRDAANAAGMYCILYVDTTNVDDVWTEAPVNSAGPIGAGVASAALHASNTTTTGATFSLNCSGYSSTNETVRAMTLSAIKVGTLH